jgi:hypothetical protein
MASAGKEDVMEFGPEVKTADFGFPSEVFPLSDFSGNAMVPGEIPWAIGGKVEGEEDMSEEAMRRLAVRRSTIKTPDAALAFPISNHRTPPISPIRSPATHNRGDISPFESRSAASPGPQPKPSIDNPDRANGPPSSGHGSGSTPDLGALLHKFQPSTETGHETKMKMFGPERVVQDPRVKAHMESVVRDIMIAASIFGAIWVGVCFAVPCYGLAQ